MFSIDKTFNRIYLTRGDNAQMTINIIDKDGNPRPIYEDDSVILTVRKSASDTEKMLEKVTHNQMIDFLPEDTNQLQFGRYIYDIELITFGGKHYTIIPPSCFEIGVEVSR